MNEMKKRLPTPDLSLYYENRRKFPPEELAKHIGQRVAFSPDGTRILASGESIDEVEEQLEKAGIAPSQVVHEYIPPPDMVLL